MSIEKKIRLVPTIGTHNGAFHCDESFACSMLLMIDSYRDASIVRSRNPEVLEKCDIVVDVGSVYDVEKLRFDHHQKTFKENMNSLDESYPWTTKLSSAGLIYFHYGKEVIATLIKQDVNSKLVAIIYNKVYLTFVEAIDAIDNGISQTDETPRYKISSTLSSRVSYLNPYWNEPLNEDQIMERFMKAVQMTGDEFKDRVNYYANIWYPARHIVTNAIENSKKIHSSGKIIFLEQSCPWKDHFFDLENSSDAESQINFVIFKDMSGKSFRVQAVPVSCQSFDLRVPLNKEWFGLRGDTLCEKSGISGCVFVHANGFIGGADSFESAVKMADKSLIHVGNGDQ